MRIAMSVEPVYGWCYGCCEYWLGAPIGGIDNSYMRNDFVWWAKKQYPDLETCEVILIHDEACDLWAIQYMIDKGF